MAVSLRLTETLLSLLEAPLPAPEALAELFGQCSVSQRLTAMCGAKGAFAISPHPVREPPAHRDASSPLLEAQLSGAGGA